MPVKAGEASGAYVDRSTVRFPDVTAKGYFSSEGMAFAAAGCAGYASPELVDLLIARIKAMRGKTPTKGE